VSVSTQEHSRIGALAPDVERGGLEPVEATAYEVVTESDRLFTIHRHDEHTKHADVVHVESLRSLGAYLAVVIRQGQCRCRDCSDKPVHHRLSSLRSGSASTNDAIEGSPDVGDARADAARALRA
jgi:hypothetical protein